MKRGVFLVLLLLIPWAIGLFVSMALENIENNNTSLTATSEKEQIANIENAVVLTNAEQKGNYSCFDASDSLVFLRILSRLRKWMRTITLENTNFQSAWLIGIEVLWKYVAMKICCT